MMQILMIRIQSKQFPSQQANPMDDLIPSLLFKLMKHNQLELKAQELAVSG
jgi:hypothetical protein